MQALVFVYVWKIHPDYAPSRQWAIGALVILPGLALTGLCGLIPQWLSAIPGNACLLAGTMIMDFGVMRAGGRQPPWGAGIVLGLAAMAGICWFTLDSPDFPLRLAFLTAATLAYDVLAIAAGLTCRVKGIGRTLSLVAAVYLVHLLSGLWRLAGAVAGHLPHQLAPDISQVQYLVVSILCLMCATALLALLPSQHLQAELHDMARCDPLTKAGNRRFLEEAWCRIRPSGAAGLACLMIDIDHFKVFNDTHGHPAGDNALVCVSDLARSLLRAEDTWCRFGGEEFLALLPDTDARDAMAVAERLRQGVAGLSLSVPSGTARLTVSVGVAAAREATAWTELVSRSDQALYRAKNNGRNRVELADDTAQPGRPSFIRLTWNAAYACGSPIIDAQHRRLFDGANALLVALMTGQPKAACVARIEELLHDTLVHFRDEEAIVREAGYPDIENHVRIHQNLLRKAQALATRYVDGELTPGELFDFLAMDVVANHMLGEDRKFFSYIEKG